MNGNAFIDTELFAEAERISNSSIEKYQDCITRAEQEFTALNSVWDDPQYEQAKLRFEDSKKYILATIEVLQKMKTDFRKDIEATNVATASIKGIWG